MATKRDQLQSHQFLVQRMVSALVTRESDPEQPSFKRPSTAAFGSLALAVLALVAVGVYGLVVPGGSKAWAKGEVVVVEKETGTRYVYVDQRLYPVTNYVSALLALGKKAETKRVSQRSLVGVPRGPQIGIRDAPDALPAKNRLLSGAWTLCSEPTLDLSGARTSESVLMVGQQPAGGRQLTDEAMLVEVIETGDQYLLRRGYRHRILKADRRVVRPALGSEPWAKVGEAFVAGLPDGQPIAPIKVAGLGKPSTAVAGRPRTLTGQLFSIKPSGGDVQYYLAEQKQLRPISALQYNIQLAYQPMVAAYGGKAPYGIELSPLLAGQVAPPPVDLEPGQAPASRPEFVAPRDGLGTICATFAPGDKTPSLSVDPSMPARDPAITTARRGPAGTRLADRILVPPGSAAVIEAMPSDRAPAGTLSLITDLGRSYPMADPKVLEVLGYAGVQPVKIPSGLVARIPQGSGLDPAAAIRQAV
ncbi:type VII secretion protein EccB [Kribbella sp. NPDC051620]|uniref:type VII secretion protein EccB n=1 Tax=Kribbella sp. NPDC051620 TaxID=3364120 RepID=UPI0037AD772E